MSIEELPDLLAPNSFVLNSSVFTSSAFIGSVAPTREKTKEWGQRNRQVRSHGLHFSGSNPLSLCYCAESDGAHPRASTVVALACTWELGVQHCCLPSEGQPVLRRQQIMGNDLRFTGRGFWPRPPSIEQTPARVPAGWTYPGLACAPASPIRCAHIARPGIATLARQR